MKTSAYTPFDVSTRDRVVGFFVIGAVLLFLLGFLIPVIRNLSTEDGIPFYTILDQTYGIAPDATVALRGVVIGNVSQVAITRDGMVRVDILLSNTYRDFYTRKSILLVDTNIGVSTILTGSGLILNPGRADNGLLESGEFIATEAPQGFGSVLEELDIVRLTDQITEIINNVESITTGFAHNQDKIFQSIDNLEKVTMSLATVSASLPDMMNSIEESLEMLQSSMAGVNGLVKSTDRNLQKTLENTVTLTRQATDTLAQTDLLMQSATPVLDQLPPVLITTNIALQSITDLTDQLSRSWLLGGRKEQDHAMPVLPASHPHDNSLYEQVAPAP